MCGPRSLRKLDPEERIPVNRYFDGSPIYPGHFSQDWNRSYMLEPDGPPVGAVVFLHGLTDSPYSLRHIARRYREHGYVSIAMRLPGHGTVPAALTDVEWEDWLAATRLAVREARKRIGPSAPLHLVGFSNGGALALMYALEALDNNELTRPDRIVLISPMVGITSFARFAGLAGLPAIIPGLCESRLAQRAARVQSVQIQLVSDQWRATITPSDGRTSKEDRALRSRRPVGRFASHDHLSIRDGLYRQHAGDHFRIVCPSARKRQRTRVVRPEPQSQSSARSCVPPPIPC